MGKNFERAPPAYLELPGTQHHQRAGFDRLHASLFELPAQRRILGAGIKDDAAGLQSNKRCRQTGTVTGTYIQGDGIHGLGFNRVERGRNGKSLHFSVRGMHGNDVVPVFPQHADRTV